MGIRVAWAGALAGRITGLARMSPVALDGADHGDTVLASVYDDHYRLLVRMATLLVQDVATAEDITEAAFAEIGIRGWMKNPALCAAYLRHAVVAGARAASRRPGSAPPARPAASQEAGAGQEARARQKPAGGHKLLGDLPVLTMLRSLPDRQREALVLRYYANLSEAEAAAAMGVTRAAVRRHTERGLAAAEGL
jgi:DNA-directed RNA polymerase specialized sigma24 family protein